MLRRILNIAPDLTIEVKHLAKEFKDFTLEELTNRLTTMLDNELATNLDFELTLSI